MRTKTTVTTTKSPEEVAQIARNFFENLGFNYVKFKKQMVYKRGKGFLTAPQIFRIVIEDGVVTIESWLPTALLIGVYVGESGIDNNYGWAVKLSMRANLREFINAFGESDSIVSGYYPKQ
ncbi:MAG: hypothetical protein LBV51_01470 [Acholeplasmatales bacterium]|jgi:hypothetical protein|nr:hypothetical protein [Acholeplasmatales bacterium]